MLKLFVLLLAAFSLLALNGCESTDDNDVAEAQQCVNNLNDSAPLATEQAAAQVCLQKITGITTSESYVIRCSIDFLMGGITGNTLFNAVESSQGQSGNQSTTTLVSALSQDSPAGTPNVNFSQATYADCQASGVESLIFIAGLSVTGTALASGGGAASCASTPSSCNPVVVGTTAQTIYGTYCQGSNASSQQCTILGTAITNGNGDPATIAQNLFNLLNQ